MTQHFYLTLEVEGNKVVKVEEPKSFVTGRPLMSIVPNNLRNQTIATALNQLEAKGWELKDVTEDQEPTFKPLTGSIFPPPRTKQSARKYYLLQYPAGK